MKLSQFQPNGYKLHKVERQVGDSASIKETTWTMTIFNGSFATDAEDLTMFLASYNRKTKVMEWRNFKNELIVVRNIGPRSIEDYVKAFAKENYDMAVAGQLRRPQLNLYVK